MDKHREVDKGWHNRNGRYAHDGDLLGIVGSAPASLPPPSSPRLRSRAGWKNTRNKQKSSILYAAVFRGETRRELCFADDKHFSVLSILCRCGRPLVYWFLHWLFPAKCTCCVITLVSQMGVLISFKLVLRKKERNIHMLKQNNKIKNYIQSTQRILN